ncbi:MAG: SH3 domain-containing protein, partial [Leptospiraceae bacterium]|nr:SH3 domain-containing protein [Leptospiraceae bacterium]
ESTPLYSRPYIAGPVIRILSDGEAVDVLRKSRNYNSPQEGPAYLVRTQDGLIGWISSRHLQTE